VAIKVKLNAPKVNNINWEASNSPSHSIQLRRIIPQNQVHRNSIPNRASISLVRSLPTKSSSLLHPGLPVTLRAMTEDPPLSFHCKDRIMIQSVVVASDNTAMAVQEIFALNASANGEHKIRSQKIDVIFLPADTTTPAPPPSAPPSAPPSIWGSEKSTKHDTNDREKHPPKRGLVSKASKLFKKNGLAVSLTPHKRLEFHGTIIQISNPLVVIYVLFKARLRNL
jgi:hypothetical protein